MSSSSSVQITQPIVWFVLLNAPHSIVSTTPGQKHVQDSLDPKERFAPSELVIWWPTWIRTRLNDQLYQCGFQLCSKLDACGWFLVSLTVLDLERDHLWTVGPGMIAWKNVGCYQRTSGLEFQTTVWGVDINDWWQGQDIPSEFKELWLVSDTITIDWMIDYMTMNNSGASKRSRCASVACTFLQWSFSSLFSRIASYCRQEDCWERNMSAFRWGRANR